MSGDQQLPQPARSTEDDQDNTDQHASIVTITKKYRTCRSPVAESF
jgi:hypothetical protein